MKTSALLLLLAAVSPAATHVAPAQPAAGATFDFGTVVRGPPIEHVFQLRNEGPAPLRVSRVALSPPLIATRMPAVVPPGAGAALHVRLDTTKADGPYEGEIIVFLDADGTTSERTFEVRGRIVAPIEVSPRAAVFLRAVRGERDEASVELVGHESAPFRVERVESASSRVTTRIEPIELGRRYRMHFTLQPGAPLGRAQEPIVVHTSSRSAPEVRIAAYTFVHERVHTFPDVVDLGAIRRSDLRREPALAERVAQTLMVYQRGGRQFEARFHSDLPQLGIRAERGSNGDRWQALVRLEPTAVDLGPISGSILVETNDPDFPRLAVPVVGTILE